MSGLLQSVLATVKAGICGVGYLTVTPAEFKNDPKGPYLVIVGTGFLARATTAITNRHVVDKIDENQSDLGFPDSQKLLLFVIPRTAGVWTTGYCPMNTVTAAINQSEDIAFVEFTRLPDTDFQKCQPLPLGALSSVMVGDPVGVCGYPYGSQMLTRNDRIYRFGPVLQQGYVSAISPHEVASRIDEILLDVRGAGGMSGSPVFRPDSGEVFGILYAGWEATTSIALPIDSSRMAAWLNGHDAAIREAENSGASENSSHT